MRSGLFAFLMLAAARAGAADPLAPYAGHVLYLDFWASWCGPCAQSFPWLNAMQARYGKQLTILGVDVDERPADGAAFLKTHPAQFRIIPDPDGKLAARFAIEGMPGTVILDAQGRVVHRRAGFLPSQASEYEAALQQALQQAGAK